MPQNQTQWTATGTFSDSSTQDVTTQASWTVSDTTMVTVGASTGQVTIQPAGKIWGADVGITATLSPGTPGTASILVIASDSGSVAPLMPQQDDHWQALGLSPWGTWWGCQEPSGSSLVGSGSLSFTLTAIGGSGQGIQYRQSVVTNDWTRAAISISGTTSTRVAAGVGTGPSPAAVSTAWLGYICLGPSTPNLVFFPGIGGGSTSQYGFSSNQSSVGDLTLTDNLATKPLVGPVTHRHRDRVHPLLCVWNRTTSEMWCATDVCVAMTSSATAADGAKGFGTPNLNASVSASVVWMATCTGSVAESYSTVSGSANLLSRLGWNVRWKDCPTDSSSIKLPFLVDHWKQLGLTPWTATWNLQEPLGNALTYDRRDGTSVQGWNLTAGTGLTYEYAVPNWTRRFITVNQAFNSPLSLLNDFVNYDPTGSMAFLVYGLFGPLGSVGIVVGNGNANTSAGAGGAIIGEVITSGVPRIYSSGSVVAGTHVLTDGRVHPYLLVYDKTNVRAKLYTDLEAITGTLPNTLRITNSITSSMGLGNSSVTVLSNASGSYGFFTFCTGSLAESLSDDGVASNFLKTLGWNPPW